MCIKHACVHVHVCVCVCMHGCGWVCMSACECAQNHAPVCVVCVCMSVWAVRPNEPSGFHGCKTILNHSSALVSACP